MHRNSLQQDGHGGLEAVGEAAVAAATGSPVRHTSVPVGSDVMEQGGLCRVLRPCLTGPSGWMCGTFAMAYLPHTCRRTLESSMGRRVCVGKAMCSSHQWNCLAHHMS